MFKQWYRRLRAFQSAENLASEDPSPGLNCPSNFTQAWMSQTSLSSQGSRTGVLHRAPTEKPIQQLFRPIKSKVGQAEVQMHRQTHRPPFDHFGLQLCDLVAHFASVNKNSRTHK